MIEIFNRNLSKQAGRQVIVIKMWTWTHFLPELINRKIKTVFLIEICLIHKVYPFKILYFYVSHGISDLDAIHKESQVQMIRISAMPLIWDRFVNYNSNISGFASPRSPVLGSPFIRATVVTFYKLANLYDLEKMADIVSFIVFVGRFTA